MNTHEINDDRRCEKVAAKRPWHAPVLTTSHAASTESAPSARPDPENATNIGSDFSAPAS
jgi:hypothetical protein